MLSPLKLKLLVFSLGIMLMPSVKGQSCSQDQDLSWVNKLNVQTQELSKVSLLEKPLLEEAELIVQNALEAASTAKTCSQAKELVRHGETGIRQTLKSPLLGGTLSTRDLNGHSKELSDSRVTETGVNDTGIDDTVPYPKLLVFVSFSMPSESLKALNTQVRSLGGKLVLRGLAGGSFQETAQNLKELQIDIIIDPPLFEAYEITQSPTFILRNSSTESAEEEVNHDRMAGNVSLDYVLEQFSTSGEIRDEAIQMLKILRRAL